MNKKLYFPQKLIILIVIISTLSSISLTQTNPLWSKPNTIPGLKSSFIDPVILSDHEGTIHLFNSQLVDEVFSIYYIKWNEGRGWSALNDIIRSDKGARAHGAHLDQQGILHLVYFEGDDLSASMYYTNAPIKELGLSTSWEAPITIGESAITPSTAAMVGDGQGFLLVVYSGNISGTGLYAVQSLDGGKTWSSPKQIFTTYNEELKPIQLMLQIDQNHQVFAVWSVVPPSGRVESIHFSSLDEEHQIWSVPQRVAYDPGGWVNFPSIIKFDSRLIIIYHDGAPLTRHMIFSEDEGNSWSEPVRLFEHVGTNGAASLTIDSSNTLHMVFGNRVSKPNEIHGAWHSVWLGERWSAPEAITSGPQIKPESDEQEGYDPSFLESVISLGNLLFVIWRQDPQANPLFITYSYKILESPHEAPILYPTQTLDSPSPSIESVEPVPTESPTSVGDDDSTISDFNTTETKNINNNLNILVGLLPVLLVFTAITLYKRYRK